MICFYTIENRGGDRFFEAIKNKSKKWVKKEKVESLTENGFLVEAILVIKDEFEEKVSALLEKFCKRKIALSDLIQETRKYAL